MRYLITGHTGFKGSWLSLLLSENGHSVSGISLEPNSSSLFKSANLHDIFDHDLRVDIRDLPSLKSAVELADPEVVIHLAAQPLVKESYLNPVTTYETNVIGTLNLLESTRELKKLKAILIITTDKVYKQSEMSQSFTESMQLGGDDPYSASKAAADIATQSWRKSFGKVPIAIARAGNVIGGGDWAEDRLMPDLVRSVNSGQRLNLRNPNSVRPWQHVLDCLNGYLCLINCELTTGLEGEWNFGPDLNERKTVLEVVDEFNKNWQDKKVFFDHVADSSFLESNYLVLDSSKAKRVL